MLLTSTRMLPPLLVHLSPLNQQMVAFPTKQRHSIRGWSLDHTAGASPRKGYVNEYLLGPGLGAALPGHQSGLVCGP